MIIGAAVEQRSFFLLKWKMYAAKRPFVIFANNLRLGLIIYSVFTEPPISGLFNVKQ